MADDEGAPERRAGAIPERWTHWWSESPSAPVLRVGTDQRWRSAAELDEATRAVAGALGARGVGPATRVVWQSDVTVASVVALLGILRSGATLVPVSAAQSATERQTVIADVEPSLVVAPLARRQEAQGVPCCDVADLASGEVLADLPALTSSDRALIVYTSGTTGSPKGAVLTHGNLAAGIGSLSEAWGITPGDRLVSALPLFHVHGLVAALLGLLTAGGGIDLAERFSVDDFLRAASSPGATMAYCVPTMLHRLARDGDVSRLRRLRLLVSGSAPLSVDLFEEVRRRSGQVILERYGMTETLLTLSNPLEGERRAGTVGVPLPGVEVVLPPADGTVAELKVGGPTLFEGYWRRPEATVEVLADGWLSTGDLVRVDRDGYVTICGRSKELIITGGFNVYPSEVEDVLRGRAGILEAAVVGRPSAEWGEEVVAFVVTNSSAPLDTESLRSEITGVLSPYKVPRAFVVVDELPRNALGKLQRHLL